jgi:hypothetical protein
MHGVAQPSIVSVHKHTHTTSIADGITSIESAGRAEKVTAARPKALETYIYGEVGATPNKNA